jgi:hypothetical protein
MIGSMNILKRTAQYQQRVQELNAGTPDIKNILIYIKEYLDGAANAANCTSYYNNFNKLYEYVAAHKEIPPKILNNKYRELSYFVNLFILNGASKQDIVRLGSLWDSWIISNVGTLKNDRMEPISKLIDRALELLGNN